MYRFGFRLSLFIAMFSALATVGGRTDAATISALNVQPGSSLEIVIELLEGAVSETLMTDVSGTIGPVELGWVDTPDGPLPDPLQIFGAAVELSDTASQPGAPFLFELFGVGADLSGPELAGFLPDGNMNSFDLQGYTLNLNQGVMVITGTTSATVDLSVTPFALLITEPASVIAKVTETPTIDPLIFDVAIALTFDFMATVPPSEDLPLPIDVFASGTIVATGIKTVPEPSSLALLSVAFILASLSTTRRRGPASQ
jgi:hypothetical protein